MSHICLTFLSGVVQPGTRTDDFFLIWFSTSKNRVESAQHNKNFDRFDPFAGLQMWRWRCYTQADKRSSLEENNNQFDFFDVRITQDFRKEQETMITFGLLLCIFRLCQSQLSKLFSYQLGSFLQYFDYMHLL